MEDNRAVVGQHHPRDSSEHGSAAPLAGLGAFVGGFGLYMLLSGMGGGVDLEDRLTFDQSGELELEGVGLMLGLVAATTLGIFLGTFFALRWKRVPRAGLTALGASAFVIMWTMLAFRFVSSGPEDPVLLPYLVFGGWFVMPYLVRKTLERPGAGSQEEINPRF